MMQRLPLDIPYVPPEHTRYAQVLAWGTRIGLALLVFGFVAYAFEWFAPHVPHRDLPQLWSQPVARYLELTGVPTGWSWLGLAHRADIFNLVGITVLAGISLPCLVAVMPLYAARGERAYLAMCLLEVLVLLLAASGILSGAH